MKRFIITWKPVGAPDAETEVRIDTLRKAKADASAFAKERGAGDVIVKDMSGTVLAWRRAYPNGWGPWKTTFSGRFH